MMFLPEDTVIRIIFLVACSAALIQLVYYLTVFSKLAFYRPKQKTVNPEPFSIIIAAKNELNNLRNFLSQVLEQEHETFQVVVVNDCSWDGSEKALEEYADAYSQLKVITLIEQEKYRHGKKFAIAIGIKGAENEKLVFTDADCYPASSKWASLMASPLGDTTQIVLGYGAYRRESNFLNYWIRYDTAFNAMQYLSFALAGMPYMGTGRNLAYTKSLFFKNKGFARHQHILSGDDDLFVNLTATKSNTVIQLQPESFTYSIAKKSFFQWWAQKRRHLSTSAYYKISHRWLLGLFFLSHFLFYASFIALLILKADYRLAAGVFAVRMLVQWPVTALSFAKLKEKGLLIFTVFFDAFITLIYPILALSNLINKKYKWK